MGLIGKSLDHLPLYRLAQMAARQGVPLALSTLADRLAELQRLCPVLHADETPVRQLDPGRGKTQTAYLWAYRSNGLDGEPPILRFDSQTRREGKHTSAVLQGWQGYLRVDDYSGSKALFKDGSVTELGCRAHARRDFFDLAKAKGRPMAARATSPGSTGSKPAPRTRLPWSASVGGPGMPCRGSGCITPG